MQNPRLLTTLAFLLYLLYDGYGSQLRWSWTILFHSKWVCPLRKCYTQFRRLIWFLGWGMSPPPSRAREQKGDSASWVKTRGRESLLNSLEVGQKNPSSQSSGWISQARLVRLLQQLWELRLLLEALSEILSSKVKPRHTDPGAPQATSSFLSRALLLPHSRKERRSAPELWKSQRWRPDHRWRNLVEPRADPSQLRLGEGQGDIVLMALEHFLLFVHFSDFQRTDFFLDNLRFLITNLDTCINQTVYPFFVCS